MTTTVGVVDYGMGNLHSVAKALSLQKVKVVLTDQKSKLQNADLLVVPGVGAFWRGHENPGPQKTG